VRSVGGETPVLGAGHRNTIGELLDSFSRALPALPDPISDATAMPSEDAVAAEPHPASSPVEGGRGAPSTISLPGLLGKLLSVYLTMPIPLSNMALRNNEVWKKRLVAFMVTLRALALGQRTQRFAFLQNVLFSVHRR
jgi:hypothetical protein